jgi:imidazoleglycerol phosphate synthase glutamine amidotransferase subunit HisH
MSKQIEFEYVKQIPIKQVPKIGRVYFCHEYFVDLNDADMVQEAKECLYEDIMSMVKNQEVYDSIGTGEAPEATYNDIPEFLKESFEL